MSTPSSFVAPGRRRRRRSAFPLVVGVAVGVGVLGTVGVLRAAEARTAGVTRIDGLSSVLAGDDGPARNFLLVGSDTREGADPASSDFGSMGDASQVTGRRSDTIMILRKDDDGTAALVSLPRDLLVEIAGTGRQDRINSAYAEGPEQLAQTVTESLGVPIHHYVEVDFQGFKRIVDDIGGVDLCIQYATRDLNTGLALQPGCQTLDGTQSLAFARSRYYEEFRDGDWQMDPTADLGRISRQQLFIRAAVDGAIRQIESSPFGAGALIDSVASSVRIDDAIDPVDAVDSLRSAVAENLATFQLPVYGDTVDGKAILRLDDGAEEILDYFRGVGPRPGSQPQG